MKPIYTRLLISAAISLTLGVLALIPVVTSDNGYVAGFVFLPLFFLVCAVSLVLGIAGLITVTKKAGPPLLLAAALVPAGFFGAALLSKQFGLGAYREEPMISWPQDVANVVLFTKGTTNEQISDFWESVLGTRSPDGGHWPLPGVWGIGRLSTYEGHEVVNFSFFPSATEEQKRYVYDRVRSSPIVYELREDVPTKDYMPDKNLDSNVPSGHSKTAVVVNKITNAEK